MNNTQLLQSQLDVYQSLLDGTISPKQAIAMARTASIAVNLGNQKIRHAELKGKIPQEEFFDESSYVDRPGVIKRD